MGSFNTSFRCVCYLNKHIEHEHISSHWWALGELLNNAVETNEILPHSPRRTLVSASHCSCRSSPKFIAVKPRTRVHRGKLLHTIWTEAFHLKGSTKNESMNSNTRPNIATVIRARGRMMVCSARGRMMVIMGSVHSWIWLDRVTCDVVEWPYLRNRNSSSHRRMLLLFSVSSSLLFSFIKRRSLSESLLPDTLRSRCPRWRTVQM